MYDLEWLGYVSVCMGFSAHEYVHSMLSAA